jgi:hypothetical protein
MLGCCHYLLLLGGLPGNPKTVVPSELTSMKLQVSPESVDRLATQGMLREGVQHGAKKRVWPSALNPTGGTHGRSVVILIYIHGNSTAQQKHSAC